MTQNTSNTNILIIEDEIAIAEGLVDLCELNGYSVKHVADGESGLNEALSGQYGLVLLDLMLPGMDGFTVATRFAKKTRAFLSLSFLQRMPMKISSMVSSTAQTTTFRSHSQFRCFWPVLKQFSAAAARLWKTKVSSLQATSA